MSALIISNQQDITTDYVVRGMQRQGVPFYRLNTEQIGVSVHIHFDFSTQTFHLTDQYTGQNVDLLRITSVYLRRPEIRTDFPDVTAGEANFLRSEFAALLEGLYAILDGAFWFNRVAEIRQAENKMLQLLVAARIGFSIPGSLITDIPSSAEQFYHKQVEKCIAKPIRAGLVAAGDDERIIFTNKVALDERNLDRIGAFPIYLQRLVEKKYDLRITVVGNEIFAAKIHSQSNDDSRIDWRNTAEILEHTRYDLPSDVAAKCVALTKALGLNFGAIDMVVDEDGEYLFLEINPNGQWAWIESRLSYPISESIVKLIREKTIKSC